MSREPIARLQIVLDCDEPAGPTFVSVGYLYEGDSISALVAETGAFFLRSFADPDQEAREFIADVRDNDGVPRWRREQGVAEASSVG